MSRKQGALRKPFRIAIFGSGKMALHHVQTINRIDNAEIIALADPAADKAKLQAFLHGEIPVYASADELLTNIHPDIVHVCTPPDTHASLAALALNHGAHVYVEKPFALTVQDAAEIVSLADRNGLKLCAGHQLLFEEQTRRTTDALRKLGRIVHVESYFSFRPVRRSSDGRSAITPLDQLVDILPHPVYLLLHFLKLSSNREDIPVEARAIEVETSGSVHGIFRAGGITGILLVTLEGRPIESYVRVIGTNGSLDVEFVRGTMITLPGPGVSGISKIINPYSKAWQEVMETSRALFRRALKKNKSYPGLEEIITAFYTTIEKDEPAPLSSASILETVSICEAIGKKLKEKENKDNSRASENLREMESRLPKPDDGKEGILVTGGTGQLGQHVARVLRGNRWPTRVLARKIPSAGKRIPGVEYMAGDLSVEVSPEIMSGISVVVHCAAETVGGKEAHERNSIRATQNILTAAAAGGVKKFIHISSLGVLKTGSETKGVIDEGTPRVTDGAARGPYVWGKAESERLAMGMCQDLGIDLRIIRPGPLVDYEAFEPPGRLGREVGRYYLCVGSWKSRLSICTFQTAADVICTYVENFGSMPPILNLVEPVAPTRAELVSRLSSIRPDLKPIRLPAIVLRMVSPGMKFLQILMRPGVKPVDIYAAFSSEKYNTDLAEKIIRMARGNRIESGS